MVTNKLLTKKRKENIIDLCRKLISNPSYSGDEGAIAEIIKNQFSSLGYDESFIDSYGNVIGHIKGKSKGKTILFDGHMDTVPVVDESKWKHPPFRGEIEDEKIFGRGASDMKGQLSAMILVPAWFKDDLAGDFSGDVFVACTVCEELFEGIASQMVEKQVKPDIVIIGEATELNLAIGQRGRAEIIIESFGKTAHSSNPGKGINAIYKMLDLLNNMRKLETTNHPILGEGILVMTDIISSPYPGVSVIPDYCRATIDRRLLVGESKNSVLLPIEDLIKKLKKNDPESNLKVSLEKDELKSYTNTIFKGEKFFKGWIFDQKEEFIQTALEGLNSMGINSRISHYSFCTNGSYYAGEKNIKTLGFGPSKEELAHIIDEYMELDQLFKGAEGYYGILKSFFNIKQ